MTRSFSVLYLYLYFNIDVGEAFMSLLSSCNQLFWLTQCDRDNMPELLYWEVIHTQHLAGHITTMCTQDCNVLTSSALHIFSLGQEAESIHRRTDSIMYTPSLPHQLISIRLPHLSCSTTRKCLYRYGYMNQGIQKSSGTYWPLVNHNMPMQTFARQSVKIISLHELTIVLE